MSIEEHIKLKMAGCPLSQEQEAALISGLESYLNEIEKEVPAENEILNSLSELIRSLSRILNNPSTDSNSVDFERLKKAKAILNANASETQQWKQSNNSTVSVDIVADIRNKLTPMANLCAMLERSQLMYNENVEIHRIIEKEIENVKKNVKYLSNLHNPQSICSIRESKETCALWNKYKKGCIECGHINKIEE